MPNRAWFVVPAAGASRRMGGSTPKQYLPLAGRTVIEHALAPLLATPALAGGVVAIAADDPHWHGLPAALRARVLTVTGGAERCRSVLNGLLALATTAADDDWVLVHDAARPCLTVTDLERLIAACADDEVGGLLAAPVADTLKRAADTDARVVETVARDGLWRALTPQLFRLGLLRRALESALAAGVAPTDEAEAVERLGLRPRLVEGSAQNLKITHPADLELAERLLQQRRIPDMRIGTGFDVHAFGPGDHVTLCGVRIPHGQGIVAHSDGDVPIHALCDALLGAAGLGDIGLHFPDTDPRWRGVDSRELLRQVVALLAERGLRPGNADVTVVAEAPRLAGHREAMRQNLAADLGLPAERVNVKATTTEGLGFVGRREGIAAQASALVVAAGPGT